MCKPSETSNSSLEIPKSITLTAASARRFESYAAQAARVCGLLAAFVLVVACSGVGSKPPPAGVAGSSSAHEYETPEQAVGPLEPLPAKVASSAENTSRSPVSLTASDGAGLQLTHYAAKVVVEGPLAFTELSLSFYNAEPRTREGRFQIRLPQGAAISRFAMHGPNGWQEAEVVERKQAQLIYEDFLHQRVDPALMEKSAGNEFSARVFPIVGGEHKQLVVSFSSELTDASRFVLPLVGLPRVDQLSAEVRVLRPNAPAKVTRLDQRKHMPMHDLVVDLPTREFGLTDNERAVVRVAPQLDGFKAPLADLTVLLDTSASRALNLDDDVRRLGQLFAALGERGLSDLPVEVLAFDQRVESIFRGKLRQFGAAEQRETIRRRALGASDLLGALEALRGKRRSRVVVISDAVATAGELQGVVAKAGALGLDLGRIDVLLSGGLRDDNLAAALARDVAEHRGVVADLSEAAQVLARKLTHATVDVDVRVEGAAWSFPKRFDGMQPGDARLLYVSFGKDSASKRRQLDVELTVSGRTQAKQVALLPAQGPLLERAAASAKISELSLILQRGGAKGSEQRQIVELSTRYRVLSDLTAMLVLESDADYQRYGLSRGALSDILVVGTTGIESVQRTDLAYQPLLVPTRVTTADDAVSLQVTPPGERAEPESRGRESAAEAARPATEKKKDGGALRFPPTRNTGQQRESLSEKSAAPPPPPAPQPAPAAEPRPQAPQARIAEAPPARVAAQPSTGRSNSASGVGAGASSSARPAARVEDIAEQSESSLEGMSEDEAPMPVAVEAWRPSAGPEAHDGKYRDVMLLVQSRQLDVAVTRAFEWVDRDPGDALALLALGEALETSGRLLVAARAYGSLIDLFPARADLRRFAATRLERLGDAGLSLAIDSYDKARSQRPDHLTGYRLQAYALLRQGRHEKALSLLLETVGMQSRVQRAALASQVLARDISLIAAAYAKAHPKRRAEIQRRIAAVTEIARMPSTSFVLSWETDANDVDLHVVDAHGDHAFYSNRKLRSGGELLEDVTRGYGPELFAINGNPKAAPYEIGVHYYSRGPMGYGMGRVEVIEHDGKGGLKLQTRPFVIMNDDAHVSLGSFGR